MHTHPANADDQVDPPTTLTAGNGDRYARDEPGKVVGVCAGWVGDFG